MWRRPSIGTVERPALTDNREECRETIMIATKLTTPFRKRRLLAIAPVAKVRDLPPARLTVLPAPAPEADTAPGPDDLANATWEDAEWR